MLRKLVALAIVAVVFALTGCVGPDGGPIGGNHPPIASFTYEQDGFDFEFDASSSFDPDGTLIGECYWWFGDVTAGSGITTSHSYVYPGVYTVRLVVVDNDGARSEITRDVTIDTPPPTASFAWTREQLPNGNVEVSFNGKKSRDPDGEIVHGKWTFGDGKKKEGNWVNYEEDDDGVLERVSAIREVKHIYKNAGEYTVTLIVTDNEGNTGTTSRVIKITH